MSDLRVVSPIFLFFKRLLTCLCFLQARHSLLAILKLFPHDMSVLAELRPILIEVSDLPLCASLYQAALEHHQTIQPLGPAQPIDPSTSDLPQPAQTFAFIDILVLADLYNTMSEYDRGIRIIRNGCRWLQGRASQRFWDGCGDDREYDLPREDRGGSVSIERSGDVQPGHYPLDVNARHRLAIARIKLGEVEEGKVCTCHVIGNLRKGDNLCRCMLLLFLRKTFSITLLFLER